MFPGIKLRCIPLLSLIIILSLTPHYICTAFAADQGYKIYRSQEHYFSLYLPNGWSIEKGRNPHVVLNSKSPDKIASIIITHMNNVGNRPITKSLAPKDMVKKYVDSGWDVRIIDSGQTTFWNEEAIYVKFFAAIYHMGNPVKMMMWQIAFNHLNDEFSIGYGAGGNTDKMVIDTYNHYEPQFRKSLTSFALDDWDR